VGVSEEKWILPVEILKIKEDRGKRRGRWPRFGRTTPYSGWDFWFQISIAKLYFIKTLLLLNEKTRQSKWCRDLYWFNPCCQLFFLVDFPMLLK
jgi:hypothetical protein